MNEIQIAANKAIEAAKAVLENGVTEYSDHTIKIGDYTNEASTGISPKAQAASIIEAALGAVFEIYRAGGEYDDVAGDLLENFARKNGIANLCGVKE